jgi:hypothetical protein
LLASGGECLVGVSFFFGGKVFLFLLLVGVSLSCGQECLAGVPSFFAGDFFLALVDFCHAFSGNFSSVLFFDLAMVL